MPCERLGNITRITRKQLGIFYFEFIPWDSVSQSNPAVMRIQVGSIRLVEIEDECCNLSIGLYIVLAPLYLKSVRKLQEKRFVFVKILAIIIPENRAKVSKIKCFQFAQQTLIILQLLFSLQDRYDQSPFILYRFEL